MVGIGASLLQQQNTAILRLLAAAASLSFWLVESLWKSFQQCYYPRLWAIENAFSDKNITEVPLQISTQWSKEFHRNTLHRFLRAFVWPHVMLPHVLIVLGGIIIAIWQLTR
jgi:hypothetical protein